MRLLKTGPYAPGQERIELASRSGNDIPQYAILSHTWAFPSDSEVLFTDVQNGIPESKPAFDKLKGAMRQAQLDGYGWLWVDTCCIDKSSSAELQESINSMYPWYQNAAKCYAYLDDVDSMNWRDQFGKAKWWSRGWTLQELLAPTDLEFFSSDWQPMGSKNQLKHAIFRVTGIDVDYLDGTLTLEDASIAKRMSWAANRTTTREEDLAYCLMGVFSVNMPMLYGEGGRRAFLRLQEEIMRGSDDHSIFLWIDPGASDSTTDYHGLLADSPKVFAHTGNMRPYTDYEERNPYVMTNRGLAIEMHLTPKDDGTSAAALECPVPGEAYTGFLAVYLKKLSTGHNQYARVRCGKLASLTDRGVLQEVYIRQTISHTQTQTVFPYHFFQLRGYAGNLAADGYQMVDSKSLPMTATERKHSPTASGKTIAWVRGRQVRENNTVFKIAKEPGRLSATIIMQHGGLQAHPFAIMLGSISRFSVGFDACEIAEPGKGDLMQESLADMQERFRPKPPGTTIELYHHLVRVDIAEWNAAGKKVYTVDIQVDPIARPDLLGHIIGVAEDMIPQPMRPTPKESRKGWRRFSRQ